MDTTASRLRWAAGAALVSLGLAGCAQELGEEELQRSIEQALSGQQVYMEDVQCPGPLVGEDGYVLTCDLVGGTNAEGLSITQVRVVVTEVDGTDIRYRLEPLAAP